MKVVAISGSPRNPGNTVTYLNAVLEGIKEQEIETSLISLAGKNISGCTGCYGCVEAKECVVKDDFQEVFQAMVEADAILLGTPVYHGSMTAELKAVLDRAGFSGRWATNPMKEKEESYTWGGCVFSGKIVAPLAVARRTGQVFALAELLVWANVNDCIIPGNTYWNMGVAGKGGAKDAHEDKEALSIMDGLAQRILHLLEKLNQ